MLNGEIVLNCNKDLINNIGKKGYEWIKSEYFCYKNENHKFLIKKMFQRLILR